MAENEWGKWQVDERWEDPKIDLNAILYEDVDEKMKAAIRNAGVNIEGGAGGCRVPNPGVDDIKKLDMSPEAVEKRKKDQLKLVPSSDALDRGSDLNTHVPFGREIVVNERPGETPSLESRVGGRK
jgi:hypothetical protein